MPGATSTEPGGATSPSPVLVVAYRQFGPQIWALCHLMPPGPRGGRFPQPAVAGDEDAGTDRGLACGG